MKSDESNQLAEISQAIIELQKKYKNQRKAINKLKRIVWETQKLLQHDREAIRKNSHRITDTTKHLDHLQTIINWSIYIVVGVLTTTLLTALIKFALSLK